MNSFELPGGNKTHAVAYRLRLNLSDANRNRKAAMKRRVYGADWLDKRNGRESVGDFYQDAPVRKVGRRASSSAPKSPNRSWLIAAGYHTFPF